MKNEHVSEVSPSILASFNVDYIHDDVVKLSLEDYDLTELSVRQAYDIAEFDLINRKDLPGTFKVSIADGVIWEASDRCPYVGVAGIYDGKSGCLVFLGKQDEAAFVAIPKMNFINPG